MKIEHVAIWTTQLEALKDFYATHFSAQAAAPKYVNPKRQFESYFLTFPDGGARLEIMRVPEPGDLHQEDGVHYRWLRSYRHLRRLQAGG